MARSQYIYIVMRRLATEPREADSSLLHPVDAQLPVAAFTVKREMVRYLRRQIDKNALRAYRMRDGEQFCDADRRPPCAEIPMQELIGGE